jgi:hypothetical protein
MNSKPWVSAGISFNAASLSFSSIVSVSAELFDSYAASTRPRGLSVLAESRLSCALTLLLAIDSPIQRQNAMSSPNMPRPMIQ